MSTWRPESQSRHTKSTWQPKESLRSTIVGCVLAAVVIVGLLLYVQLRTPAAAPPKREITEQEFCDSARKFGKEIVLARLKAPATAVFSDNVETGLKREGSRVLVFVTSHVDSENSFSALLRSNWGAQLSTGSDRIDWHVEFLMIGDKILIQQKQD